MLKETLMASHSQKSNFHTDTGRLIKDKIAQFSIFSGGVMVLAALLMIFFYLLYVVAPIFESASITSRNEFKLPAGQEILAVGMEEQTEIAYLLNKSGGMDFYQVKR